jgi:parafibromin
MYNVVDFLQNGKFVTAEEKKKEGAARIYNAYIKRTLQSGQVVEYKIIDNPSKLKPEDWDRVAAVFCTGQAWQFKDWKWSNPAELFANVIGAHVCFDDRVLNTTVQSWNCKVLKVFLFIVLFYYIILFFIFIITVRYLNSNDMLMMVL